MEYFVPILSQTKDQVLHINGYLPPHMRAYVPLLMENPQISAMAGGVVAAVGVSRFLSSRLKRRRDDNSLCGPRQKRSKFQRTDTSCEDSVDLVHEDQGEGNTERITCDRAETAPLERDDGQSDTDTDSSENDESDEDFQEEGETDDNPEKKNSVEDSGTGRSENAVELPDNSKRLEPNHSNASNNDETLSVTDEVLCATEEVEQFSIGECQEAPKSTTGSNSSLEAGTSNPQELGEEGTETSFAVTTCTEEIENTRTFNSSKAGSIENAKDSCGDKNCITIDDTDDCSVFDDQNKQDLRNSESLSSDEDSNYDPVICTEQSEDESDYEDADNENNQELACDGAIADKCEPKHMINLVNPTKEESHFNSDAATSRFNTATDNSSQSDSDVSDDELLSNGRASPVAIEDEQMCEGVITTVSESTTVHGSEILSQNDSNAEAITAEMNDSERMQSTNPEDVSGTMDAKKKTGQIDQVQTGVEKECSEQSEKSDFVFKLLATGAHGNERSFQGTFLNIGDSGTSKAEANYQKEGIGRSTLCKRTGSPSTNSTDSSDDMIEEASKPPAIGSSSVSTCGSRQNIDLCAEEEMVPPLKQSQKHTAAWAFSTQLPVFSKFNALSSDISGSRKKKDSLENRFLSNSLWQERLSDWKKSKYSKLKRYDTMHTLSFDNIESNRKCSSSTENNDASNAPWKRCVSKWKNNNFPSLHNRDTERGSFTTWLSSAPLTGTQHELISKYTKAQPSVEFRISSSTILPKCSDLSHDSAATLHSTGADSSTLERK